MKKITLKIAAIVLLCSVVFFACKKDKPAPEPTCGATLGIQATAFEAKATAFSTKITNNPALYTKAECAALRIEAVDLIAKAKACPELAADVALMKELDDALKVLICI